MISSAAIRRHLCESLEWAAVKTRCRPIISDANKQKKMEIAKMLWIRTTWTSSSGCHQNSSRGTDKPCVWRWAGKYPSSLWLNMRWKFTFGQVYPKRSNKFSSNDGCSIICEYPERLHSTLNPETFSRKELQIYAGQWFEAHQPTSKSLLREGRH